MRRDSLPVWFRRFNSASKPSYHQFQRKLEIHKTQITPASPPLIDFC